MAEKAAKMSGNTIEETDDPSSKKKSSFFFKRRSKSKVSDNITVFRASFQTSRDGFVVFLRFRTRRIRRTARLQRRVARSLLRRRTAAPRPTSSTRRRTEMCARPR